VSDFLTKPFDRTEVLLRAKNLLHTRALHGRVRDQNAELQRELEQQRDLEQRARVERSDKRERVRSVLDGGGPRMVFQPIADLESGVVVGYEALARFDGHPSRPPNNWFADAAEVGLASELELAAVSAALRRLPDLPPAASLSVNVSPDVAATTALAEMLGGHPPDRVILEVTEHARIDDYDVLHAALAPIRDAGVRLAVDDAGAGFAGLQHILRLRPDIIKLDISLTRGIDGDPVKRALASSLVRFADDIRSLLIAEGIETRGELDELTHLGVARGQGYLLGQPGPLPARSPALARAKAES
jgi:EAL domain-containing protein (putative c-di-GMP-specific phosphodiesterase class I)